MKIQAVAYCRVSGKGQTQGSGLDRQEESIRAYAKNNGYEIQEVYLESHTGTEIERPVFDSMLAELLTNGCRVIVIERLDRLARDLQVQMGLIGLLCSKGVALISADTQQDITKAYESDPMNKLVLHILGAVSECDKSMIVYKLKKGRLAKRLKTGSCEGRKPYGYYPGESAILEKMKVLHRKKPGVGRLSYCRIARVFNAEPKIYPTRHKGGKWWGSTVKRILERKGKGA